MSLAALLILFLAVLGIYFIAMSRVAGQLTAARQWRHLGIFLLGLLAALVIFIPSPDLFGPDHRFTVSMGQFLLAVDFAPLLLFKGIPAEMLSSRQGRVRLDKRVPIQLLAGFGGTVVILAWFVPALFQAASGNLALWLLKQLMFLVSGLWLWGPVAGPLKTWKPAYPVQLAYLFIMRLPMTVLGVLFTFASQLIYSSRSFALELCAPSSLADQQTGGLVMWMVGGLIIFAEFAVIFMHLFDKPQKGPSKDF